MVLPLVFGGDLAIGADGTVFIVGIDQQVWAYGADGGIVNLGSARVRSIDVGPDATLWITKHDTTV